MTLLGRLRRGKDATITAAKMTVAGTILAAVITAGVDIGTSQSSPPPAPVTVTCTTELDRLDRFVGSDPTRVIMFTRKGADGVAPLERDTGAKACGIDVDDLKSMVDES
jgi:hypothetical protein